MSCAGALPDGFQVAAHAGSAAMALRRASPHATPNRRFVALADRMLARQGRMVEAVTSIGRGADCFESKPFAMELR